MNWAVLQFEKRGETEDRNIPVQKSWWCTTYNMKEVFKWAYYEKKCAGVSKGAYLFPSEPTSQVCVHYKFALIVFQMKRLSSSLSTLPHLSFISPTWAVGKKNLTGEGVAQQNWDWERQHDRFEGKWRARTRLDLGPREEEKKWERKARNGGRNRKG